MPLPSPFIDPWRSALCSAAALGQPLGAASSQPLSAQMHEVPVIAAQMRAAVNIEDLPGHGTGARQIKHGRSEEHTSELQSLMRISYAVFCLKKKKRKLTKLCKDTDVSSEDDGA